MHRGDNEMKTFIVLVHHFSKHNRKSSLTCYEMT